MGDIGSIDRKGRQLEGTHLFLVRLQAEELDEGEVQWHGRVQRVVSGETYTFAGWPDLIEHLLTMLPNLPILNQSSRHMSSEDKD
jgi:hypothetical protein